MRFDGKNNAQMVTKLSISKLSNVQRPAHEDALAAIIKSNRMTPEEIEKQTFMEALNEINMEEAASQLLDATWDLQWALRRSIRDTLEDQEVENKKEVIQNNIADFASALSGVIAASTIIKGDDKMKPEEIKKMIEEAVSPVQKELAVQTNLAKMNDVTKSYYEGLSDEEKEGFLKMDVAVQKSTAEAAHKKTEDLKKANDESIVVSGKTIMKSEVGDAMFAVIKSQQEEISEAQTIAKAEREAREQQEFVKQAEGLLPNLPGDPNEKGIVLKSINTMPANVSKSLMAMLAAGNAAIEKGFDEIGAGGVGDPSSAVEKLNKMADSRAEEKGIPFAKAYSEVLETEEGQRLYEEQRSERR